MHGKTNYYNPFSSEIKSVARALKYTIEKFICDETCENLNLIKMFIFLCAATKTIMFFF